MKNIVKSSIFFLFILLSMSVIVSCDDDEKDFDFKSYMPVIKSLSGNSAPMQGRYYEYTVPYRGGSTFNWDPAQSAEVVTSITDANWKVHIGYPDIIEPEEEGEKISVTEITSFGVESEMVVLSVDSVMAFSALEIDGSTVVNGGFVSNYSAADISALDMIYSSFKWESSKGTLIEDEDEPWNVKIEFSNEDVGEVTVSLIETSGIGMVDTTDLVVDVLTYCPIESNALFVGSWVGEDGFPGLVYDSEVEISAPTETGVTISGLNGITQGWMYDWWGEETIEGGSVEMNINEDGTIEIPRQYYITTLYDGDPYEYEIEGSGRWNNCGDTPSLEIRYVLFNTTDGYELPSAYYSAYATEFSASIVLE